MDSEDQWGVRLAFMLRKRKKTQRELAAQMDVSAPAVNKWIAGGAIEYERLRRLSSLLCVNWVWLRYGDEGLASARSDVCEKGECTTYAGEREVAMAIHNDDIPVSEVFCNHMEIGTFGMCLRTRKIEMSRLGRQMFGFGMCQELSQADIRNGMFGDHLPEQGGLMSAMLDSGEKGKSFRFGFRATGRSAIVVARLVYSQRKRRPIGIVGGFCHRGSQLDKSLRSSLVFGK